MMTILLAGLLALQTVLPSTPQEVGRWVDQLRSASIEERNEAIRKLRALGKAALPALEKAATDPDPGIASRAKRLIDLISLAEKLGPEILRILPGVEEQLLDGTDQDWARAFLMAAEEQNGQPKYPHLNRRDLEPLLPRALKGVRNPHLVLRVMMARGLRLPETELKELLQTENRSILMTVMEMIWTKEDAPVITSFLTHPNPWARSWACLRLECVGARDRGPDLSNALKDGSERVVIAAAKALGELAIKEEAPKLLPLLADPRPPVVEATLRALRNMGDRRFAPDVLPLLKSSVASIRLEALMTLGDLDPLEGKGDILKLLQDPSEVIATSAARCLSRMGLTEGVPLLLSKKIHLSSLNAIRNPEAWNRLRSTVHAENLRGSAQVKLDLIARQGGLELEWPRGLEEEIQGPRYDQLIDSYGGAKSLLRSLEIIGVEFVLEGSRLRAMSGDSATGYWNAWWEQDPRRKK